jgi:hypothetical protein
MVLTRGAKKFTKRVIITEMPVIPVSIKAKFFKFFNGLLVTIRLIMNNITGIRKTGPNSIIKLTAL